MPFITREQAKQASILQSPIWTQGTYQTHTQPPAMQQTGQRKQQDLAKGQSGRGATHHGVEARAEVVGRDEDVVGAGGAVPVWRLPAHEVDGVG